jgi:TRAP-type mannitol/chloroaromatic compound transport system permease small subunit
MRSAIRGIDVISEYSGRFASWFVYVGIIMLSFEVIARYLFNSPTMWAHGYTQRIFGSYFVLIGAFTFVHQGHVRIDIIQGRFSARWRSFFDVINALFLLVWSGILIPASWNFFLRSYRIGEVDEMVLSHPIWWVKLLLFVGMVLIFLQGLSELAKKILELANPEKEQALRRAS